MDPGFCATSEASHFLVLSSLAPSSIGASLMVHPYGDRILFSFQINLICVSHLLRRSLPMDNGGTEHMSGALPFAPVTSAGNH